MADLIDTTEMYLRTIYELEEEGITPLRARIAERLGHSGPTVSQTVARMERDGLVVVADDRHLQLTEAGRELATRVMRKHRLAERLLTDVIGLEWPYVHDEACRWEHVMSQRVEERLLTLLDHPHLSPYGNPIPGLGELGEAGQPARFLDGVVSLDMVETAGTRLISRIAEALQTDIALLNDLAQAGVTPGALVQVGVGPRAWTVGAAGVEPLRLDESVARHIFVAVEH